MWENSNLSPYIWGRNVHHNQAADNEAKYFIQVGPNQTEAFWKVHHNTANRIDVSSSGSSLHGADPGEEVITTLRKRFVGSEFHWLILTPGEYYPRMARPHTTLVGESPGQNPDTSTSLKRARTESTGQLHALIEQLEHICRIVHPDTENFQSFGHEIRNVLVLACTEVEAQWKNIMKANGIILERPNTNDYVKLLQAMKLNEYTVELNYYPWLDPIEPFKNWTVNCPSQSLDWYNAYNLVKHDREQQFSQSTLKRTIDAVTACFVILCAQYGWDFALKDARVSSAFFRLSGAPSWTASEIYTPFGASTPRNYPF